MSSRKTSVERLVDRLGEDLGIEIPDGYEFSRLYPGHWQRSSGAWSWQITYGPSRAVIGSCSSVRSCLRAARLSEAEFNEGEIHAE